MHRTINPPQDGGKTFHLQPHLARALFAIALLALVAGLWLRFGLVENMRVTQSCLDLPSLRCGLRLAVIEIFNHNVCGAVALAAALTNLWRPHLLTIAAAVPAAMLGLVLYNTTVSALAVGVILLAFARPSSGTPASTAQPRG